MPQSTLATASPRASLCYDDISPQQHQLIDALYEQDTLAIAPVGFGKAVCGQTAAQALLADDVVSRVLIVAPLKVARLTWGGEWTVWEHLREPALALGSPEERLAALRSDRDIVVINIENVPWLFKQPESAGFDGLLIDETSKFKSAGSKGVGVLRRKRGQFVWRAGLSATPVAEAGMDIYSQALLIDGGRALGTRKDAFLAAYMYPTDYKQRKWAWQPGAPQRLARALRHILFVADSGDYTQELPALVSEVVTVEMPPAARDVYCEMAEDGSIEIMDIDTASAGVVTNKLMQIAAGAIYRGEPPNRETLHLHDEKFGMIARLINCAAGPVLVAYQFEFEKEELLSQGFPLFDGTADMETRWNAGEIPVMCLHPKSASHGLNLQYGGYELLCMGPVWSADQWQQLVGRLRRRGQPSGFVKRTTIVAAGTVDELVLDRAEGKSIAENALMAHLKQIARA